MSYPKDHYWGPISSQYFSSKTGGMVTAIDIAFLNWVARGGVPTPVSNISDVRDVIAKYRVWTLSLPSLYASIDALPVLKKNTIFDNILGPSLLALTGATDNLQSIIAIYVNLQTGAAPPLALLLKTYLTALYCQDNPNYLVNPVFDPTINIPGTTF